VAFAGSTLVSARSTNNATTFLVINKRAVIAVVNCFDGIGKYIYGLPLLRFGSRKWDSGVSGGGRLQHLGHSIRKKISDSARTVEPRLTVRAPRAYALEISAVSRSLIRGTDLRPSGVMGVAA
jgi:hypothetical protein